jgi:hypothetical protein
MEEESEYLNEDEEQEYFSDYEYIEKQLALFDNYIEVLWNKLLDKYIRENNYVLSQLTEFDKSKFYKFMYDNSPAYLKLCNALKQLY